MQDPPSAYSLCFIISNIKTEYSFKKLTCSCLLLNTWNHNNVPVDQKYLHGNSLLASITFSEIRRWTLKIPTYFHVNNPII